MVWIFFLFFIVHPSIDFERRLVIIKIGIISWTRKMNVFCLGDKNHVMLETSYGKFDTLMLFLKNMKVIHQCYKHPIDYLKPYIASKVNFTNQIWTKETFMWFMIQQFPYLIRCTSRVHQISDSYYTSRLNFGEFVLYQVYFFDSNSNNCNIILLLGLI